jgi:hypothetical protein
MLRLIRSLHRSIQRNCTDPVARPGAVVKAGHARFAVLTPQLIRMEWASNGEFEDHPSLVILNRNLPVPKFTTAVTKTGTQDLLTLKADSLTLTYIYNSSDPGKFNTENLDIDFTLNGQTVTRHPGLEDTENLQGTTRTLDGALGGKTKEPMGLISRAGWVLVETPRGRCSTPTTFASLWGSRVPGHG